MQHATYEHYTEFIFLEKPSDELGLTALRIIDALAKIQPKWNHAKHHQLTPSSVRYKTLYEFLKGLWGANRNITWAAIQQYQADKLI